MLLMLSPLAYCERNRHARDIPFEPVRKVGGLYYPVICNQRSTSGWGANNPIGVWRSDPAISPLSELIAGYLSRARLNMSQVFRSCEI